MEYGIIRSLHASDADGCGAKLHLQSAFKIPFSAGAAAEYVEAKATEFREGMTGQVRLGKQTQARDSSRLWELMPLWVANGMQLHSLHHACKKALKPVQIRKRSGVAAVCLYDPLTP
jgi:hypothetical protein